MPYVRCGRCGLRTFSASYWSNVEYCAGCGAEFPRRPRKAVSVIRSRHVGNLPRRSASDGPPAREASGDEER